MMPNGDANVNPTAVDGRHHHQEERVWPQHHHAGLSSALSSLRVWTSSIAESTMVMMSEAQRTLEAEQASGAVVVWGGDGGQQQQQHHRMSKRDINLPLDVKALRETRSDHHRHLVVVVVVGSGGGDGGGTGRWRGFRPVVVVVVAGMGLRALPPTLQGRESYIHRGGVHELLPIDRRPSILFGL